MIGEITKMVGNDIICIFSAGPANVRPAVATLIERIFSKHSVISDTRPAFTASSYPESARTFAPATLLPLGGAHRVQFDQLRNSIRP